MIVRSIASSQVRTAGVVVFARGNRRATLEAMDRDRVTLQVSLDSGTPEVHDRQRGPGSFARALQGLRQARDLGG